MAYTVSGGTTGSPSDLNQLVDAITGNNDQDITLFSQLSPPSAPTVSVNTASGNLTGNYQYALGFETGYWQGPVGTGTLHTKGNTGGGTASSTISPNGQQANVDIPSAPTGVVNVLVYRTKENGSTFYYLATVQANTSTQITDNALDSELGAEMPTTNTTGGKFKGDGSQLTGIPKPSNATSTTPGLIQLAGDLTGTATSPALTTTGVAAGTYTKVTVDAKGRVTGGSALASKDVTAAIPNIVTSLTAGAGMSVTNPSGVGSAQVTNTGVTSVSGGAGISVSASTGGVTITNTSPNASASGTWTPASGSLNVAAGTVINIAAVPSGAIRFSVSTDSWANSTNSSTSVWGTMTAGQSIWNWFEMNSTGYGTSFCNLNTAQAGTGSINVYDGQYMAFVHFQINGGYLQAVVDGYVTASTHGPYPYYWSVN